MNPCLEKLRREVATDPRRTVIDTGELRCSWSRLQEEVTSLAAGMKNHAGSLALLLDNGPAWIASDLAAMESGRTMLSLPAFFSDAQLAHALHDAGVSEIFTDQPQRIRQLAEVSSEEQLEMAGQRFHRLHLRPERIGKLAGIAKITYTSGTTGKPKGVPLHEARIAATTQALCRAVNATREDRALVLLPLAILLENIGSAMVPILAGATLLVPPLSSLGWQGSAKLDPSRFSDAIARFRPTTAILTPELLKLFIDLRRQRRLPDSFRFIAVGGATVSTSLLAQARELGLPVFEGYGLSEAASVVTLNTPHARKEGSAGQPLPGYRLRIADDGEVLIRGTGFTGLGFNS